MKVPFSLQACRSATLSPPLLAHNCLNESKTKEIAQNCIFGTLNLAHQTRFKCIGSSHLVDLIDLKLDWNCFSMSYMRCNQFVLLHQLLASLQRVSMCKSRQLFIYFWLGSYTDYLLWLSGNLHQTDRSNGGQSKTISQVTVSNDRSLLLELSQDKPSEQRTDRTRGRLDSAGGTEAMDCHV